MNSQKKNTGLYFIIAIFCILVIGLGGYIVSSKLLNKKNNNAEINISDSGEYIDVNGHKLLKEDLKLTNEAKISSSKVYTKSNLIFASIVEPTFQFETYYLLCFDKDANLIFEARNFHDKSNGDNRYKYNGKFEYDEDKNVLSFDMKLFLGENDEATGKAFDNKFISELTKDEMKILENYSDVVKYEYKYENQKFKFLRKKEISKLKDNEYFNY